MMEHDEDLGERCQETARTNGNRTSVQKKSNHIFV
jgi:hypothetical protein